MNPAGLGEQARRRNSAGYRFGCGVVRKYGLIVLCPLGNLAGTSASATEGEIMQSCPGFQSAGVATLYLAVSWSDSTTRKISSKLRPVDAGYVRSEERRVGKE